jgi:hypothetical protein
MNRRAAVLSLVLLLLAAGSARAAEPVPTPRKFFFATGSTRGTVGGHVLRGRRDLYSLQASAGQIMTITLTAPDDNAVFQVWEPNTALTQDADGVLEFKGTALRGAGETDDATRWTGRLPRTGVYLIAIGSTRGNARYSMDIKVE